MATGTTCLYTCILRRTGRHTLSVEARENAHDPKYPISRECVQSDGVVGPDLTKYSWFLQKWLLLYGERSEWKENARHDSQSITLLQRKGGITTLVIDKSMTYIVCHYQRNKNYIDQSFKYLIISSPCVRFGCRTLVVEFVAFNIINSWKFDVLITLIMSDLLLHLKFVKIFNSTCFRGVLARRMNPFQPPTLL